MNSMQLVKAVKLAQTFEGYVALTERDAIVGRAHGEAEIGQLEVEITRDDLADAAVVLREYSDGMTLEAKQRRELQRACAGMPYGALVSMSATIETVDDVTAYLTALSGVLENVAARARDNERELDALRLQRASIREFLGIDELADQIGGTS